MARYHGKTSVVKLDNSSAALQDISDGVDNVDAGSTADTAETTGFGDSRKQYVVGHLDNPITLSGKFDDGSNKSHAVLSGILGGTTPRTFEYYPAGTASGKPKYSGEVLCTSYNVVSPIGGAITFQATLVAADGTGLVWSTA